MSSSLDLIPAAPKAPPPPAATREKPSSPSSTEEKASFADTLEAAKGPAKPHRTHPRKQASAPRADDQTAAETQPPAEQAKGCQPPAAEAAPTDGSPAEPAPAAVDPILTWLPTLPLPADMTAVTADPAVDQTDVGAAVLPAAGVAVAPVQLPEAVSDGKGLAAGKTQPLDPVASIATDAKAAAHPSPETPLAPSSEALAITSQEASALAADQAEMVCRPEAAAPAADAVEPQGRSALEPAAQATAQAAAAIEGTVATQPAPQAGEPRPAETRMGRLPRPETSDQSGVLPATANPNTAATGQRVPGALAPAVAAETEGTGVWHETRTAAVNDVSSASGSGAFVDATIRDKAAAPVAKPAAAGLPLPAEPVVAQIVERASLNADGGEMRIELKPEFLGPLKIRVATENHQVALKIVTSQPMVKEMIESQIHLLKNDLGLQGLHIDKVDVSVARDFDPYDESRREGAFQSARDNGANGGQSAPRGRGQGGGGRPPFYPNSGQAGIDYFA